MNWKNELLIELISTQQKLITEDKKEEIENSIIHLNKFINTTITKFIVSNNDKDKERKVIDKIPGW